MLIMAEKVAVSDLSKTATAHSWAIIFAIPEWLYEGTLAFGSLEFESKA